MAQSVKAPITPEVLVWARKTSSMNLEDVAGRIRKGFPIERLEQWEAGEDTPTIPQLRKLSEIYKRPLATFFLLEPPKDFAVPRDFRRVQGAGPNHFIPSLRLELRQASERREAALNFLNELDEEPIKFQLYGRFEEGAKVLAARARKALGISIEEQNAWRDQYTALKAWKSSLEEMGVLVFQVSGISSEVMRGFSIWNSVLPVIAVNRSETPKARIFSLMHELCHLMLRQSGVCDFIEDTHAPPEEQRIEIFCNAVAAEILVPEEHFMMQPEIINQPRRMQEWDEAKIIDLARRYHVSRIVIVRRLLTIKRCSKSYYVSKQKQYLEEFLRAKAIPANVPERWGEKRVRILGDMFTKLVLNTYYSGHISLSEALGQLQIKTKHLPQVERTVGGG